MRSTRSHVASSSPSSGAAALAQAAMSPARASAAASVAGSAREAGSARLSTTAPTSYCRRPSSVRKNSASRSGDGSGVATTTKDVRSSESSRATARARSTNPPYMECSERKNSVMSSRNCVPRIRSAIWVNGRAARPRMPPLAGAISHRSSLEEKNSSIRAGASRKSRALRVGGVSTTIRSHSPVPCSSCSRSIAM